MSADEAPSSPALSSASSDSNFSGGNNDSDNDGLFAWADDEESRHSPLDGTGVRDSKAGPYQWSPLRDPQDIRLIALEPAIDQDAIIRCTFIAASVADAVPYTAISYAWGATAVDGSHLTDEIVCDFSSLRVTSTVNGLLKQIRSLSQKGHTAANLPLWIDAICIDQADIPEKNHQVKIMGSIYEKCSCLLVWLGNQFTSAYDRTALADVLELAAKKTDQTTETQVSSIQALLERSWFNRRWAVQEFLLASHRQFLVGPHVVDVDRLLDILRLLKISERPPVLAAGSFARRREFTRLSSQASPAPRSLLTNLNRYADTDCLNAHDRIYALLSISNDAGHIVVDYDQDTLGLYTSVAKHYVRAETLSELLASALNRKAGLANGESIEHWPSWVADWRGTQKTGHEDSLRVIDLQPRWIGSAEYLTAEQVESKNSGAITRIGPLPTPYAGSLALRGVLVGLCESSSGRVAIPAIPRCQVCLHCRAGDGARRHVGGFDFWRRIRPSETVLLIRNQTFAWVLTAVAPGYHRLVGCHEVHVQWKDIEGDEKSTFEQYSTTVFII